MSASDLIIQHNDVIAALIKNVALLIGVGFLATICAIVYVAIWLRGHIDDRFDQARKDGDV